MTAKGRGKRSKIPGDRYYTPQWVVDVCLKMVLPVICLRPPKLILEPSAGTGRFLGPLRQRYPEAHIVAIDNDPDVGPWPEADESLTEDYLEFCPDPRVKFDLTIGNPPFSFTKDFCEHALTMSKAVVFLARYGILSAAKRAKFWREHRPSHIFNLANRPNYDVPAEFQEEYEDAGGDFCEYCFVAWAKPKNEATLFEWLPVVPKEIRQRANG
jgi:hypothetical protein